MREKRKREADEEAANADVTKRVKLERETAFKRTIEDLTKSAEGLLEQQIAVATEREFQAMYPEKWKDAMEKHLVGLEGLQREVQEKSRMLEAHERKKTEKERVVSIGRGVVVNEAA